MNTRFFTLVARVHKTDRHRSLRSLTRRHLPLRIIVFWGSLALDDLKYSIRHLVQDGTGQN
ncbi:MAG TPA: hypothetical protein VLA84_20250 [Microcoleus sp.]|nr:hypothetical protein [Microcoleus sp.]